MALIPLLLVGVLTIVAGVRLRRLVPTHWVRTRGRWTGPALQFEPDRYQFSARDGSTRSGTAAVKTSRLWYGGTPTIAYDPDDPDRSQPAAFRRDGAVLIVVGGAAIIATVVLAAVYS